MDKLPSLLPLNELSSLPVMILTQDWPESSPLISQVSPMGQPGCANWAKESHNWPELRSDNQFLWKWTETRPLGPSHSLTLQLIVQTNQSLTEDNTPRTAMDSQVDRSAVCWRCLQSDTFGQTSHQRETKQIKATWPFLLTVYPSKTNVHSSYILDDTENVALPWSNSSV